VVAPTVVVSLLSPHIVLLWLVDHTSKTINHTKSCIADMFRWILAFLTGVFLYSPFCWSLLSRWLIVNIDFFELFSHIDEYGIDFKRRRIEDSEIDVFAVVFLYRIVSTKAIGVLSCRVYGSTLNGPSLFDRLIVNLVKSDEFDNSFCINCMQIVFLYH
jgi:hypothetical protein